MHETFAEMHFHTAETSRCATAYAKDSIAAYKRAGYDAVVVTDHYFKEFFPKKAKNWESNADLYLKGYRAALEAGKSCGLTVLLGMEIRFTCNGNDYLVYGVTEDLLYGNPCLYEHTEETFYAFAKEHGLFVVQAHPYRPNLTRCPAEYLDGLEIYNANPRHMHHNHNREAEKYAKAHHLIEIVDTDFHEPGDISGAGLLFEARIDNSKTLIEQLYKNRYKIIIPEGNGTYD